MKTIPNSAPHIGQSGNALDYDLTEILFCLSIGSVFLPWKLYPAVFLLQSAYCAISTYRKNPASLSDFLRQKWIHALWIFTVYAVFSYFLLVPEHPASMSSNLLKMLINILFLTSTAYWLENRSFSTCLPLLNTTLHLIFFLCLIQLLVYHQAFHFHLLSGASSSAKGSILYNNALFFWGLPDKNMFGARLALLGFIYILIPLVQKQRISCFRIGFIFLLAFLSLSRTPLVALLIGVFLLAWFGTSTRVRIALAVGLLAAIPFIGQKLLRIDQLLASNDGMGVRITYWKAFFQHFSNISPWGNGFLNGGLSSSNLPIIIMESPIFIIRFYPHT